MLHLLIIEDHNEHLHEVLGPDLGVEGSCALVHEHVEQAEREEHNFGLIGQQPLPDLVGGRLTTTVSKALTNPSSG